MIYTNIGWRLMHFTIDCNNGEEPLQSFKGSATAHFIWLGGACAYSTRRPQEKLVL